ncbi:hypothetical protein ACWD04_06805 [Streptomyces sp. NPDC002911]
MSPLTVTARNSATGPVLAISGDLDQVTAPGLRQAVERPLASGLDIPPRGNCWSWT